MNCENQIVVPAASQEEAENGEITNKAMTPLGVKQAISSLAVSRESLVSPSGASMVGFRQPSTNASTRNVASKLSEFSSVADYLPVDYVIDGTVDYTSQIQNCIDENTVVEFPIGIFLHSRLILKHDGQIIRGKGQDATILICPHGYGFTNFSGNDDDAVGPDWIGGPVFEKLTMRGGFNHVDDFSSPANSWAHSSGRSKALTITGINAGIRLKRCFPYSLRDVAIQNFHRGVYASGAALGRWSHFLISDCEVGMYGENGAVWGDSAWQVTTHDWQNGRFRNCWLGIYGYDFVQCQVHKKTVDFEPCNTGIAVTNGADNVWSGYFELCYEGIYRNGSDMGHDVIEDPFFAGSPNQMWGEGKSILLDSGIGGNGKVTLRMGQRQVGGGGIEALAGKLFRPEMREGALITLSPAVTPSPGYTEEILPWTLANGYDEVGVFSSDNVNAFVIPEELNGALIMLRASIWISGDATPNDVLIEFRKNNASFAGAGQFAGVFAYGRSANFSSAPIKARSGDEFTVVVSMNLSRALATSNYSWWSLEVIG